MKVRGILRKMAAEASSPVNYFLRLDDENIKLNDYLGKTIKLHYTQTMHCIQCDREIKKSFQQGYCYPCYKRLLECNLCIIHPEKCRFYEGHCDPNDWAHAHCGKGQVIYFSNTSGIKVGITRDTQIPTRWIDQGAIQAIPFMTVSNRYQAGVVEVALKNVVYDKTNWRAMLKNEVKLQDMLEVRDKLMQRAEMELGAIIDRYPDEIAPIHEDRVYAFEYPVLEYPSTIKSFNFDKQLDICGTLLGIKGQYIMLDTGVMNLRKFGGYLIEVELG